MPPNMDGRFTEVIPTKRRRVDGGGCLPAFCQNWGSSVDTSASSLSLPVFPRQQATSGDDVDQILAAEMYGLSVNERDEVYDDLHGTSQPVLESAELISTKIAELDTELERIPSNQKRAYSVALQMSSDYVRNDKFCLMFLRAKRFSAAEAAKMMVDHFEIKQRLFGPEKLVKTIEQSDFGDEEMAFLKQGVMRVLGRKDTAGRSIFCVALRETPCSPEATGRALFYSLMTSLEDEEMQKKGAIMLYWIHCPPFKVTNRYMQMWSLGTEVIHSVPIRPVGLHYCGAGKSLDPAFALALKLASRQLKVRFRAHFGSPLECIYALVAYGISRSTLPVDEANELRSEDYHGWLKIRRQLEEARHLSQDAILEINDNFFDLEIPRKIDILMGGNGKEHIGHPGNVAFRQILDKHATEYHSTTSRKAKGAICQQIIYDAKENGRRFLTRDEENTWKEMEDSVVHVRIAHAFRNRRRLTKSK